jgi:hypothetical protein
MSDMTDREYLTGEDAVSDLFGSVCPSLNRKEGWFWDSES